MTFDQLIDFIKNQRRMPHIYQPLMLRSLVEAGGSATVRQLAHTCSYPIKPAQTYELDFKFFEEFKN
jgi:hypothetical protein